ncbi:MAG: GNAT family N-acetyltransferase [Burkholderiaceae bacterium]
MIIRHTSDIECVNWVQLAAVFERAPLGTREPGILEALFRNSQVRCFVYAGEEIVGAGRALTDWHSWSIFFDVVLLPEYQGRGHGRSIMNSLEVQAGTRHFMLHSVPGREGFYQGLGYRSMATAMAKYQDPEKAAELGYIK